MREYLSCYWNLLWRDIPFYVYEIGAAVFFVGVALCLYRFGMRKGLRKSAGLLLIEYVCLIYCSTVIFRGTGKLEYNFMPFWSYLAYFREKNDGLLAENIMNVVVFIPVGVLAGIASRGFSWRKALALSAVLSIGIEILQFVLRRGLSEVDDVMHNTLGCVIGYGVYLLFSEISKRYALSIQREREN